MRKRWLQAIHLSEMNDYLDNMLERQTLVLFIFLPTILLWSCSYNKVTFTKQELKWTIPYQSDDTVIYQTRDDKRDTIIFYQVEHQVNSTSNFEQGFYNNYTYGVDYRLTINSYHKNINPNEIGTKTSLYDIEKSSDNPTSAGQEFCFLGLIFDYKFLENISEDTNSIILFDGAKAQYREMNINEGIKSFKFQKEQGIISFIDKNNEEWFRLYKK